MVHPAPACVRTWTLSRSLARRRFGLGPRAGSAARAKWPIHVRPSASSCRVAIVAPPRLAVARNLSIPELRAAVTGRVITPDDAEYDAARTVFVGGVDRHPAVIVRVADAADVAYAISVARATGHELAVRSGGHGNGALGVSEGGIVIDLRDLQSLEIDVDGRTAWAGTGLTAGAYSTAAGAHGLATGFGDTGSVGLGGITLGGGIGYLVRKYGLTIDDLLAAEVVTADGETCRWTPTITPTCSGRSAAVAETSGWPRASGTGSTRSRASSVGCCSCRPRPR